MVEIIPSINVVTFSEIQSRIARIEPHVLWCHIDVTDGRFSSHVTWNNSSDLLLLDTKLKIEVHLMVQEPEKVIDTWLSCPIDRIIVHLEASKDMDEIIKKCRNARIECGIAIRPETAWQLLLPWIKHVDFFQFLAVNPGPSGQKMSQITFENVIHLRKSCPSCIIEIDGGINNETAKKARETGADILISAGYIFSHTDIATAIQELKQ